MNFTKITNEYYSKWLDITPETMNSKGVIFKESSERDKCQIGYFHHFDIYTFVSKDLIAISYSGRLSDKIKETKSKIHNKMTAIEVANVMEYIFNTSATSSIKFCYDRLPVNNDTLNVTKLHETDYPYYLEFYRTQYPEAKTNEWLEGYFYDICKNDFAFGIFLNNKLVSVTDAPSMSYMKEKVQEIGINTLSYYRGKGYAKSVTLACIKSIIEKGKCPIWSCSTKNTASEQLAYKVGFKKLADVITICT